MYTFKWDTINKSVNETLEKEKFAISRQEALKIETMWTLLHVCILPFSYIKIGFLSYKRKCYNINCERKTNINLWPLVYSNLSHLLGNFEVFVVTLLTISNIICRLTLTICCIKLLVCSKYDKSFVLSAFLSNSSPCEAPCLRKFLKKPVNPLVLPSDSWAVWFIAFASSRAANTLV